MERYKEDQERIEEINEKAADEHSNLNPKEKREKIEEIIEEAKQLRKKENYDEGIEKLVDGLKYGVEKSRIYYRLGNTYYDAGELDRAEYAYNRAIEEKENHVNAHHNLAVIYKEQGKIAKSVKQRKKAKKIEMKNPPDVDLDEEERKSVKKFALKSFLYLIGIVAAVGALVFLIIKLI